MRVLFGLIVAGLLLLGVPSSPSLVAQVTAIRAVQCTVPVSTATTLTAMTGECAAPGVGRSLYLTDIVFGSSVASGTAADSFPTLKSGTGTDCGTGTAVIWSALSDGNATIVDHRTRPIKVPADSDVCWMHSGVGSKVVTVGGFVGPS